MYNVGVMVFMDNYEHGMQAGIILEVARWPDWGEDVIDLYIHWTNGEKYWCSADAVTLT